MNLRRVLIPLNALGQVTVRREPVPCPASSDVLLSAPNPEMDQWSSFTQAALRAEDFTQAETNCTPSKPS